jgi:hypothetical protein
MKFAKSGATSESAGAQIDQAIVEFRFGVTPGKRDIGEIAEPIVAVGISDDDKFEGRAPRPARCGRNPKAVWHPC